jgi:hypothetical protein
MVSSLFVFRRCEEMQAKSWPKAYSTTALSPNAGIPAGKMNGLRDFYAGKIGSEIGCILGLA